MFGHQITYQKILLDWSPEQFGEICGVRFQWSTILTACEVWIMEQEPVLKFFIHKMKEWYHHPSVWHQESSFPGGYELFTFVKCFCRCWRSTCCWWPCPTRLRGSLPWKILMVRQWTDWPRLYSLIMKEMGDVYERQVGYVLLRK